MTGVEILNSYEYVVQQGQDMSVPFILCIIGMVLAFSATLAGAICDTGQLTFIGVGVMIICFVFMFICPRGQQEPVVETRYEVVLSDSVNYNDFADQYEIIEQRGRILVVRDRKIGGKP